MNMRKTEKKWGAGLLAALLSLGLLWNPPAAEAAAEPQSSGSYTRNGTFHIDQFGEYDIHAEVTVTEGTITGLQVTGDHFGGTYGEVNRGKLSQAAEGMTAGIVGLSDEDAEGIQNVDVVSGATYSSNGIKAAVRDALDLEAEQEQPPELPAELPEPGTYEILVAVRSDVVDHSLIQTDTAPAVLQVEEDGTMRLSYRMVSGTDQEPMYILGFNGYYIDNEDSGELSMEGVTFRTEEAGEYQVVTQVSVPLPGELSRYYYNNVYIYVPAMGNLNGEISGIRFENGHFSVKSIITMDWSTLKKQGAGQSETREMEITAEVAEHTSAPSYTVSVPESIAMGGLEEIRDNIQNYEIAVSSQDKEGIVTVSAPGEGILSSGSNTLAFANDFGTQYFDAGEAQGKDALLKGRITIAGEDVAAAAPGNYTGTTTFTISYRTGDGDPDDPGDPGDETLDIRNLEDGVYSITGNMVKVDKVTPSMSDRAINR